MSIILAGGAGFIGSRLCAHFVEQKQHVLVLDNLCRGKEEYLPKAMRQEYICFHKMDIADIQATAWAIEDFHQRHPVDVVWHMAANSDIPAGIVDANVDFKDTFTTTFSLLQAMRPLGINKIAFASSSAIYGDHGPERILDENIGPLLPISNYGAMKLASEAALSAAAESWLEKVWIFRFPNVVGLPATHGVILDFIHKLQRTPGRLDVLGNGTQQKAYLHVEELVEAMLFIASHAKQKLNVFNIGPEDAGCSVAQIAEMAVEEVSPGASIIYGMEGRGWVGDVPKFLYSVRKLADLGWRPTNSSIDAVRRAIREILSQEKLA